MPGPVPTLLRCLRLLALGTTFWPVSVPARVPQTRAENTAELDLPAYEAELDRCAASLKRPGGVPALRKSLPRTWLVRSSEDHFEVSTEWLSTSLQKWEHDPTKLALRDVEARLSAMRKAAADLEAGPPRTAPTTAREHLEKILNSREFAGVQGPSAWEIWKARAARWIADRVYRLLSRLHLGASAGNALAWITVGLALVALSYWVWQSLSRITRVPLSPAPDSSDTAASHRWAKDALAAAERGDYREAVHCAYWAVVGHMEDLGILKRDRSRTPRESLRLLDSHPTEQESLREFTRHFELIWYGYRPAAAEDWTSARKHMEKMGCRTPSTAATANS
jgi:Domain of unknown function (DUF4129)